MGLRSGKLAKTAAYVVPHLKFLYPFSALEGGAVAMRKLKAIRAAERIRIPPRNYLES